MREEIDLRPPAFGYRLRTKAGAFDVQDAQNGGLLVWVVGSGTIAVEPDGTRNGVVIRRLVNGTMVKAKEAANG